MRNPQLREEVEALVFSLGIVALVLVALTFIS